MNAFGAVELARQYVGDSTQISHAHLLVAGEWREHYAVGRFFRDDGRQVHDAGGAGGSPVTLHLQLADMDSFWERAVAGDAVVTMALADQFWGDRYGQVVDPFGHRWSIVPTKMLLTEEQIKEASSAYFKKIEPVS